ncbi:MAG: hypothetical protein GF317_20960 [Candidatus Lokiarchaeota archaeon]|nr:hypothetical protein [Candidatus Lokiarchaeota archaeon]
MNCIIVILPYILLSVLPVNSYIKKGRHVVNPANIPSTSPVKSSVYTIFGLPIRFPLLIIVQTLTKI